MPVRTIGCYITYLHALTFIQSICTFKAGHYYGHLKKAIFINCLQRSLDSFWVNKLEGCCWKGGKGESRNEWPCFRNGKESSNLKSKWPSLKCLNSESRDGQCFQKPTSPTQKEVLGLLKASVWVSFNKKALFGSAWKVKDLSRIIQKPALGFWNRTEFRCILSSPGFTALSSCIVSVIFSPRKNLGTFHSVLNS